MKPRGVPNRLSSLADAHKGRQGRRGPLPGDHRLVDTEGELDILREENISYAQRLAAGTLLTVLLFRHRARQPPPPTAPRSRRRWTVPITAPEPRP
jgi:hypothetical protein